VVLAPAPVGAHPPRELYRERLGLHGIVIVPGVALAGWWCE
jgi:hypothetical protein